MKNDLVFKTGLVKRALGWLVCLGAVVALVAIIYGIFTHPESQTPSELSSGAVIGVFLVGLAWAGIAIQNMRWSIEGENIIYHGLFKNRTIPLSKLAGFGQLTVIVMAFPFQHVDFYDRQLAHVARLPVSLKDWPKAEAWLAARLRYVVNDGSHILPKLRFADTPKI
ncbi:hypothetical protein G4G27_05430 [Sphingomonas sp. So64.6b]|uniref:hypothetical protein n=1 Tax=Sphingomonas sp. So64.6b TaxID=2997354 RepID=UPI0016012A57|nr:hypothetical protein [Sphingomonas sp. So64.6b]QNA83509.1 hypothetical protein G4G27_05430 [Sphingomonas sp. So64.6b]